MLSRESSLVTPTLILKIRLFFSLMLFIELCVGESKALPGLFLS